MPLISLKAGEPFAEDSSNSSILLSQSIDRAKVENGSGLITSTFVGKFDPRISAQAIQLIVVPQSERGHKQP